MSQSASEIYANLTPDAARSLLKERVREALVRKAHEDEDIHFQVTEYVSTSDIAEWGGVRSAYTHTPDLSKEEALEALFLGRYHDVIDRLREHYDYSESDKEWLKDAMKDVLQEDQMQAELDRVAEICGEDRFELEESIEESDDDKLSWPSFFSENDVHESEADISLSGDAVFKVQLLDEAKVYIEDGEGFDHLFDAAHALKISAGDIFDALARVCEKREYDAADIASAWADTLEQQARWGKFLQPDSSAAILDAETLVTSISENDHVQISLVFALDLNSDKFSQAYSAYACDEGPAVVQIDAATVFLTDNEYADKSFASKRGVSFPVDLVSYHKHHDPRDVASTVLLPANAATAAPVIAFHLAQEKRSIEKKHFSVALAAPVIEQIAAGLSAHELALLKNSKVGAHVPDTWTPPTNPDRLARLITGHEVWCGGEWRGPDRDEALALAADGAGTDHLIGAGVSVLRRVAALGDTELATSILKHADWQSNEAQDHLNDALSSAVMTLGDRMHGMCALLLDHHAVLTPADETPWRALLQRASRLPDIEALFDRIVTTHVDAGVLQPDDLFKLAQECIKYSTPGTLATMLRNGCPTSLGEKRLDHCIKSSTCMPSTKNEMLAVLGAFNAMEAMTKTPAAHVMPL